MQGLLNNKPLQNTKDTLSIGESRKTLTGLTFKTSNTKTYDSNTRLTRLSAYPTKGAVIKVA